MQCDARVDGRGQQSTHASMPRVARRTRIRTGTVRRAAKAGAEAQILLSCENGRIRRAKGAYKGRLCGAMHVRVCRHTRRPTNIGVG